MATSGLASSCGLFGPREYLVRVDSLQVPASIAPTETFEARFFGLVGGDACSRLTEVERSRPDERLVIRFHAERSGGYCVQMHVRLDHTETLSPPYDDSFTIAVIQPSGPSLERSISVR